MEDIDKLKKKDGSIRTYEYNAITSKGNEALKVVKAIESKLRKEGKLNKIIADKYVIETIYEIEDSPMYNYIQQNHAKIK